MHHDFAPNHIDSAFFPFTTVSHYCHS